MLVLMPLLSRDDHRRVAPVLDSLSVLPERPVPWLSHHVTQVRELLDAEQATSFGFQPTLEGERLQVSFHWPAMAQAERFRSEYAKYVERSGSPRTMYDPMRVEARQRNRAMCSLDFRHLPGWPPPTLTEFHARFGLAHHDQLRVLVSEGGRLLAWVGGYRDEPFTPRERGRLQLLAPALQRRLRLEQRLAEHDLIASALDVALDRLPGAAFIVGRSGRLAHANAAGRASWAEAPELRERVALLVKSPALSDQLALDLVRIGAADRPPHWLVTTKGEGDRLRSRLAGAVRRWSLTQRQAQVLGLIARGYGNLTIAIELGCAVGTVELHVTAILAKAGCDRRAQLLAALLAAVD